MLDFVDGLTRPVLYSRILSEIKEYIDSDEKFKEFIEGEHTGAFHFNEYFIVERFIKMFAKLRKNEEVTNLDL